MRSPSRFVSRSLRVALLSLAIAAMGLAGATVADLPQAHADDDLPVAVGVKLIARADVEIQKVVIARSTKLEVTATAPTTLDVALPDGHVLHKIPMNRVRYFFDVVR